VQVAITGYGIATRGCHAAGAGVKIFRRRGSGSGGMRTVALGFCRIN